MAITAGTEVQLKSGGPIMTVENVDGLVVHTVWFAGTEVKRDSFFSESLKPYVAPNIRS